jgi:plastocyanin
VGAMGDRRFNRVASWCASAALCGALVVGGSGVSSAATKPGLATHTAVRPAVVKAKVKIVNYLYKPKTLTIAVGTKVIWKNLDSTGHTVTFSGFGSPTLGTGATWGHKFTKAGTFSYHCSLHLEMTATVIVNGP